MLFIISLQIKAAESMDAPRNYGFEGKISREVLDNYLSRAITQLGLTEAKALVEAAPKAIKEGINKAEAEEIKAKILAAGGTVEVK